MLHRAELGHTRLPIFVAASCDRLARRIQPYGISSPLQVLHSHSPPQHLQQ